MGGFEKTTAQKKAIISAANLSSQKTIQKKAVSVIQKAAPEEELQQHKSDGTVQKAGDPKLEEKPLGVTQHKISQENPVNEIPVQRKENKTGMPDNLKSGVENLSGMSMDHVRVHYNSSQPAQLNALAYAQGSDIHVASGQEKHLPHEAWHVVQQAQGRVKPTMQMKSGVAVNDDPGLEHEADVMGDKALSSGSQAIQTKTIGSILQTSTLNTTKQFSRVVQMATSLKSDVLNVVGENHEISAERKNEEEDIAETYANGKYWLEDTFVGIRGNSGDDPGLRLEYAWSNVFNLLSLINNLNIEILLIIHEQKEVLEAKAKDQYEAKIKELFETIFMFSGIISEPDPERMEEKIVLLKKALTQCMFIGNNYNRTGNAKELDEEIKRIFNMASEHSEILERGSSDINDDRSKHMFIVANQSKTLLGIWKIGQSHVDDMESYEEAQEFNLISEDDFDELYFSNILPDDGM